MKQVPALFWILMFGYCAAAQVATGGSYTLLSSVMAGGGSGSSGDAYAVTGTVGQPAAGQTSVTGTYSLHGGFWQPTPLAPTAGAISINGRVTDGGRGISKVRVYLSDGIGMVRFAVSSPLGHYRFSDVAAGQTYVLTAYHNRYIFYDNPRILYVTSDVANIDFAGARSH